MTEELRLEFKAQLETEAQPVKDKAALALTAAVQKSQELDIFNDCTRRALVALRETYRPEQFPKMSEEVLEMKGGLQAQAIGGDLLVSVQAVPLISTQKAQENAKKADEFGKDIADLDRLPPPAAKAQPQEPQDEPL
jgi:hypothetical protein